MEFIKNIKLVTELLPSFNVRQLTFFTSLNYYIDQNIDYESISYLEIIFIIEQKKMRQRLKVLMKFNNVSSLYVKNLGGSYNQILGFEIEDKTSSQWEKSGSYHVKDYEDGILDFYCETIEILTVNNETDF
ncbi:hypothetical protein KDC22_09860 [Paenibacillus tritici]|uniref:hypothetical protein n=1 Tax=Paenibacillus tritici TaxID=1873425 RepID=UPI001BA788ED|nr:hypothetical protein [Paenibacillus tritici]QUL56753.1 hypothetical protein KDC22_09860 [Paenibacillus tritici]